MPAWLDVAAVALLPWAAVWRPTWTPVVAAAAVVLALFGRRARAKGPLPAVVVLVSAALALVLSGGVMVAGGWLALAAVVAVAAAVRSGSDLSRPDVADLVAAVGWGAAYLLRPALLDPAWGGWLAPLVLLLAARRASILARRSADGRAPASPSREVRGTLSLDDVVLCGDDGTPRTVPLGLEVRAGDSLAMVCDSSTDAQMLAETLAGRRLPLSGDVLVDGVPLAEGDRVCAMVAPGEEFLAGDLEENLSALCDDPPEEGTLAGVVDACNLDEVVALLDGAPVSRTGAPLSTSQRLLVLAARVLPSAYRMIVVVDPMPWTDAVRREIWRGAVVRASVGRTAIWITADRELAARADRVLELRHGSLRAMEIGGDDG